VSAWNANDALALYRTGDILAVGWMANHVRERMHGDKTYFNVNRHINPTNVCVAACRLCAFGRKKDTPGAYTMALDEAFETAASGYSEAVTEFHIVGGLHPDLPFQYFLRSLLRSEAALSAGASQGLHHGRGGVSFEAGQALDSRNAGAT
jgi:2-iminoacetate synthase ThiH